MTYEQTLDYLYNQLPVFQQIGAKAYKPGLQNSEALDRYFGYPHRKFKTIHIAGTNGKGSTSHLLAAILQKSGYKTGLYTSPHLIDFRERIRVNGEMISQSYIINFTEKHIPKTKNIHPSFFELTMMMAFDYFAYCQVDVAIIETGLGGRLDSTNIISPDLAIITNISYDHMQFLGHTLPEIAREKAGIIKEGIPVIIGEADGEVRKVFIDKVKEIGAPILFAEEEHPIQDAHFTPEGKWVFESKSYPHLIGELGGFCQEKNAATVLTAIKVLSKIGYTLSQSAIYEGFAHVTTLTGLQGRWQKIQNNPTVICDTGHNTGGMQYIARQISSQTYDTLRIVIGMVNDKDINGVLALLPQNATYYFTQASIPRALPAHEMKTAALHFGLSGKTYNTVEDAYIHALEESQPNDFIFIGGSTFIVADLLKYLNRNS